MVGASKILTVSYGTFSCTLEGFDDPFTAMKAIAEYFRELAADDRYFGAEPPTPDMDMLHRIAEREVQRRVEAQVSEHGVVLRAKADEAPLHYDAPAAPQPAPMAESTDETDSIAAKLMRIRAVVAASRATAEAARPATSDPMPGHPLADDDSDLADDFRFGLGLEEDGAEEAVGPDMDHYDGLASEEVADAAADEHEDAAAEAVADDVDGEAVEACDDQHEAEIEAVEAAAEEVDDEAEIEVVEAAADEVEDEAEIEAVEAAAEEVEGEAEVEAVEAAADEVEDEAEVEAVEAAAEEVDDEAEIEAVEAAADEVEDEAEIEAVEAAADEVEDEAEIEAVEAAAEEVEDEAEIEAEEASSEPDASEGALDLAAWRTDDPLPSDIPVYDPDLDEDWTPVSGARARVIKIHRAAAASEPEAPGSTAAPEPAPEASAHEETARQEEETGRSAIFAALVEDIDAGSDDEPQNEELAAEDDSTLLAGIGAAIGREDTDAEDALARELAAIAREARRDAHEGRAILESTSSDDDASIERLMEEAKSKLEGVENRRRFSAISHLKAAVAATVADRKLASSHDAHPQDPASADADMNRYRDDLSKAVRPRRPETDAPASTPRPKTHTGVAPLVLVTEQRVDGEGRRQDEDVVRPRRISADTFMREDDDDFDVDDDAPVSPEDAKDFADFAERLGATSLSELLEAAAAYTATVEGQPHFSRPQILRKVADVAEDTDFSREAGLRSFGMLLREGKIQKISRGQFRITGASKFLAEGKTASR